MICGYRATGRIRVGLIMFNASACVIVCLVRCQCRGCGAWGLGIRDIYYIYRIQGISGFRAKGL